MFYYRNLETHRQQGGMSLTKLAQKSGVGRDLIRSAEKKNPHRKEKLMLVINALNGIEDRVRDYGRIDPDQVLKAAK